MPSPRGPFMLLGLWILLWIQPTITGATPIDPSVAPEKVDVLIFGATPAGIAAAVTVARRDPTASIRLVTPYSRIGGMMVNGLTHPDFRTFEARTGLFREFNRRVLSYYQTRYGSDSTQVRDCLRGTHAGPEMNYRILRSMLDELPNIQRLTRHRLEEVERIENLIREVTLADGDSRIAIRSDYFIDATYEGDLMAAAGVPYRIGREGQSEHGESLAPATPDNQLQGYNFRLTMTDDSQNRVQISKPREYQAERYLELIPLLERGQIKRIFGDPYAGLKGGIYKRQTPKLPNQKRDINDVSHSLVRLSLPNWNRDWPDGDASTRNKIFDRHVQHNVGMLYFLQNDPRVPKPFRDEANQWGLCRDELVHNNHLPEQLYVREARRMQGAYIFTQSDTERLPGTRNTRARFRSDAIAMGDYGPNCHGTFHEGPTFGGKHTGEFYQPAAPYQIPYGVILPQKVSNLAVPVACSSSHVGFCALRLEPIWMSLGQAAGEAVSLARMDRRPLQKVTARDIRERLHSNQTATIYTADVPEESPDFAAIQWFGSLGGFIDLDSGSDEYGKRGHQVIGQYYAAFPDHEIRVETPITPKLREAWLKRLQLSTTPPNSLMTATTRGDFIRKAYSLR